MKNAEDLARYQHGNYRWSGDEPTDEDIYMMNLLLAELVMAVKDVADKLDKRNKAELNKHI